MSRLSTSAVVYAAPLLISVVIPSRAMPWLGQYMKPMLDYFSYEEVLEMTNEEFVQQANVERKKFILAMQPHGIVSFCSLCHWVNSPEELKSVRTAVASVLLKTPILKNVMGIYGLTPATNSNVRRVLQNGIGTKGSLVLYIGGIAEMFKSSQKEERLYLKNRKGFVKIALQLEGVDIIPVYLFGNTTCLSVIRNSILSGLSRRIQVAVTYYWGKWFLPIPRAEKLLFVRGKPLGLPYIPQPTSEDIIKWHGIYCDEVKRLFEENKDRVPSYKRKELFID